MKKILVVLTGGTIGSKVEGNIIDVSSRSPYRLISMYEEQFGSDTEFEVINPMSLLSENMTPEAILVLLKALAHVPYEDYSGIIVTHGSDTLSYTAAFVGMLFGTVSVPIVMVASNYPLGVPGSNGLNNFARAVELIKEKAVKGVFVLYQDNQGKNQVYLATRIVEAEPFLDQFRDFTGQAFGEMTDGHFCCHKGVSQPSLEAVAKKQKNGLQIPEAFHNRVMLVRPYPGLDYSQLRPSKNTRAVLHYLYHSATGCMDGTDNNMLLFAERCQAEGIDFYTASYKHVEGKQYATGESLLQAGVIPLLNLSPEAAYAKLLLSYNQPEGINKELAMQNLYFESVEKLQAEKDEASEGR